MTEKVAEQSSKIYLVVFKFPFFYSVDGNFYFLLLNFTIQIIIFNRFEIHIRLRNNQCLLSKCAGLAITVNTDEAFTIEDLTIATKIDEKPVIFFINK